MGKLITKKMRVCRLKKALNQTQEDVENAVKCGGPCDLENCGMEQP